MDGRVLDFVALGILITVVIIILYAIIYIHDIPYEIAKKRNHPHLHAIHTAGWVSLFLMHALWPFLWIWATLYVPDKGWGMSSPGASGQKSDIQDEPNPDMVALKARVAVLEERLESALKHQPKPILKQKPQSLAEEA
ncbi:MAG: DUF3302 domain-containing protein [Deltaproteobacteria bacterium]|nr:DUF3302 domain-containing protein [Deltaproteobacteria bacterium]